MKRLTIIGDPKTPTIDFDPESGILEIKGRSWPEHAVNVYEPVFAWLDEYGSKPKEKTIVRVSLEYFNTSSSKVVLDIFKKLDEIFESGVDISVEWFYETDDIDLQEEGEIFQELIKMPVKLIGIEEFDFTFL